MTNPKTPESRAVAGRTKQATVPSTSDSPAAPDLSTTNNQNAMLEQLVSLTQSIGHLVQRNTVAETTDTPPPPSAEEIRAAFAYDFLGVVLGRRDPRVFQLRTVDVIRGWRTLTFTGLNGATVAKIRADNNRVQILTGLRDGVPVRIDEGDNAIFGDQRIDSIIIFNVPEPEGIPVAIGPCLAPLPGEIAG